MIFLQFEESTEDEPGSAKWDFKMDLISLLVDLYDSTDTVSLFLITVMV